VTACSSCGAEVPAGQRFCGQCGTPVARACPTCGAENPPDHSFCGSCGTSLTPATSAATALSSVSERRLVSVLFADLVGFTTLSEHRDPEEVRELLSRYFDRCRTLIERYGGTVEKFIGDAVMAVWGTPVAREDDPERAVRAALALTQAVTALGEEVGMAGLRVRAGVLTGSAAVEVGAEGEGMVLGDTVNTASRLQSIASPGSVLVDDVTRRASEAAIAYEDAGSHEVKGRDQPVHAWTALSVVAGAGGARRGAGLEAPFVGREAELALVVEAAEESAATGAARLVAVTGEAGTGKSRLLWEFFKYVDGIEDRRWWHEGRCLSYGDGVAYWALAEMIRARAGIAEDEDTGSAREKLRATVQRFLSDERERRLVEPRLAHLLGLEQRTASEPADLFSGWRMFFERMAASEPVILVFEDLQWADSGLLDFVDYLLEWSAESPIFILALARPELEARRPGWDTTTRLGPLPPDAMQTLLSGLVPGLPADLTARILDRAEGVPLYAVETVRMLLDRGVLAQDGSRYVVTGDVTDLDVPETLHALVAARLDNLEVPERALLQDAAVLGTSFSADALSAVAGRPDAEVRRTLDALIAKQVLSRDDDVRAGEPGQYRFLQALVRTIALGTLSRRDRKARHLAAAEHLRATWGDGTEIAEVLASHYLDAVAAEPEAPDADTIRALACQTLATAGHRAGSLALGAEARRYFEQAAELADDEALRATLLAEAGAAAARSGERDDALALLGDSIAVLDANGRSEDAARTRALLADVLISLNRLEDAAELIDRARASLTDEAVLAELAARRSRIRFLIGDADGTLSEVEVALGIADPRDLKPLVADALITKAIALGATGRRTEALALLTVALEEALTADVTETALRAYFNLASMAAGTGRTAEARSFLERGIALARERGNRSWERDLLGQEAEIQTQMGDWDDALANERALRISGDDDSARQAGIQVPVILAARGQIAELDGWLERGAPTSEWHELRLGGSAAGAIGLAATGRAEEAGALMAATGADLARSGSGTIGIFLSDMVDVLLQSDREAAVEEILEALSFRPPIVAGQAARARGLLHERRGEHGDAEAAHRLAVTMLRGAGYPFALARALLAHGTCLLGLGRADEAAPILEEARSLFADLGAAPWLERTDDALRPVAAA
jgi:class 3 adenylate cyclase/tetratricopeptide (TPR) repeat protein